MEGRRWQPGHQLQIILTRNTSTQGDGIKTLVDVLRDDTQPQPMTDTRSTHRLQDPTSTWGPKWAGWELSESAHAEAGQHNALTSRLAPVHAMG